MRVNFSARANQQPEPLCLLEVPSERLRIRDLELTARSRFNLKGPLLIVSLRGPTLERYILSSDEDLARLHTDRSFQIGRRHPNQRPMVQVQTLEGFLETASPRRNAEAIKRVVLQTHISNQASVPFSEKAVSQDLETLIGELRRLRISEHLISQIRHNAVTHWATNLVDSEMIVEEDSQISSYQSVLGKGRKVTGGFADQSSIGSIASQNSSFFSQASDRERSTKSSNRSKMSIENSLGNSMEMKQMFQKMDFAGHYSVHSDLLNWQLESIAKVSGQDSDSDSFEFDEDVDKSVRVSTSDSRGSRRGLLSRSILNESRPEDRLRKSKQLSSGIRMGTRSRRDADRGGDRPLGTFKKQKPKAEEVEEMEYVEEGSELSSGLGHKSFGRLSKRAPQTKADSSTSERQKKLGSNFSSKRTKK